MELFTIGHSNLKAERFLALLQQYGITLVVDIRSIPYSRRVPQFNKDALTRSLGEAGIAYSYAGNELGGFPKDPQVYRSGRVAQSWDEVSREIDYRAIMKRDWYLKGIDQLVEKLHQERTVILCAEENPSDCHRQHLVAQSLLALGVKVTHIRSNGKSQPAWLTTKEDSVPEGEVDSGEES